MKTRSCLGLVALAILATCTNSGPTLVADVPIPSVATGTNFSFDLGTVDASAGRYYFTDRNNKSVDVIDTKTNKLVTQITGGFAGCFTTANVAVPNCVGADNGHSGPNGINLITGTNFIYVGDVASVKIIDKTSNTVIKSITVATTSGGADTHLRADEGCFDPDDNVYMVSNPEQTPPFATFISTATQTIIAKITFPDSAGLEACVYDHGTKSFLVNNDGSTPNPHGEVDVIPASFVAPGNPNFNAGNIDSGLPLPAPNGSNGFKVYPEGDCDPTGIDLGPGTDMAVSCREGTVGSALNVLIMDRTSGNILATVNAGGSDQISYDSNTNRYYAASSRWNATGKAINNGGTCSSANPCTPVLNVIDAGSRKLVNQLQTGNNAHSVAVSGPDSKAFVPYSSASAPSGCSNCSGTYPNGGVSVFSTQ
jgi:hypothetical protein